MIRAIEQAAVQLRAGAIILGGLTGAEREFYLSMGYRGRHDGGLMSKTLLRPRGRVRRQLHPVCPLP